MTAMRFECFCGKTFAELSAFVEHFTREHRDKVPEWWWAYSARNRRGKKWELVNDLKLSGWVRVRR